MKRKIFAVLSAVMILASGLLVVVGGGMDGEESFDENVESEQYMGEKRCLCESLSYTMHDPIRIDNNTDFADQASNEGWAGNGSEGNPYIIEGYEIDGGGYSYCIYIGNTTDHFVVRDNYLHNASGIHNHPYFVGSGLHLYNITNGRLDNNTVSSNDYYGIYLLHSNSNNTIVNNTVSSNDYYGIYLLHSNSNNTIVNNTVDSNNYFGIYLESSSNNTISTNTANSNNGSGLHLYNVTNSRLDNNTVSSNANAGIYLESSSNNTISTNTANSNDGHGFYIDWHSSYNTLTNNTANSNDGHGFYIDWHSSYNTLTKNTAKLNNESGIKFAYSAYNTFTNNAASNNGFGIYLYLSDDTNIANNTVNSNNGSGIFLDRCYLSTLMNNTVSSNANAGIYINRSSDNDLTDNTISDNRDGIYLHSSEDITLTRNIIKNGSILISGALEHWNTHSIDTSNTYNDKPIYYWKNQTGGTVPLDAGEVILANCAGVTVENQNISDGSVGILLGFSDDNSIQNNTVSDNRYGIRTDSCSHNTLTNNTGSNNGYGFYIYNSNENIIADNNANSNIDGFYIDSSELNELSENTAANNDYGFYIYNSNENIIADNNANSNTDGFYIDSSELNELSENTAANNDYGFYIYNSNSDNITNNNISSNYEYGIYIDLSSSTRIYHNQIIDNINQAYDSGGNQWDNGYPSGGNYWSDHEGIDILSGPNQSEPGTDSIGDSPYTFNESQDNYPLMYPWGLPWHANEYPYVDSHINDQSPTIWVHVLDDIEVDETTIELYINGFKVSSTKDPVTNGYNVSYIYEGVFEDGKIVNCRIVASDYDDNVLDWTWDFTVDVTHPSIISVSPPDGSEDVTLDTDIQVNFSEPMDKTSVEEAFHISPSVNGTFDWDDTIMIFDPDQLLPCNTDYTITIDTGAKDLADNHLTDNYSWNFNTNDTSPPEHFNENPSLGGYTSNTTPTIYVHVTDKNGVEIDSIKLYVESFLVDSDVTPITNGYNVSYWHDSGFSQGQTVACRIVASDICNNTLDFEWNFTVVANAVSVVVETEPGATQTAGEVITGFPEALVADEYGNPVEDVDVTVSEVGGYIFDVGTTTVATNETGVATFSDLMINEVGSYTLEFSIDDSDDNVDQSDTAQTIQFDIEAAGVDYVEIDPSEDQTITAGGTIYFNATAYDRYGNLIIDDAADFIWANATDGVFNEETVGVYHVTASYGDVTSNATEVTVVLEFEIVLSVDSEANGWNFVSFNVELENNSLSTILEHPENGVSGNYDRMMYYDASVDEWLTYVPGRPEHFNDLQEWNHTIGVWIRMTGNDTLTLVGDPPSSTNITLYPGWNMVGLPSAAAGNHDVPTEVTKIGYFQATEEYNLDYEYDPANYTFAPANGYWVYNSKDYLVEWTVIY
ncbi:MAG: NosD domain-containing protein [Thermoplasmata archaeon]